MPLPETLRRLLTAPGPSGYEQPAAAVFRDAAGKQTERWFHFAGCRRWLTVERDTVTNEVHAVH